MSARTARLALAVAASVVINLAVFGLSDVLSRVRPAPLDISEPVGVQLVTLPEPDRPEPEPEPPPPEPDDKPRLDFSPRLETPAPHLPQAPELNVAPPALRPMGRFMPGNLVFSGSDLDAPPRATVRTPPPYPYRARQRNIEGAVEVKLLVQADGTIGEFEILGADPPGFFEDAVRRTVPTWRFEPGQIAGEAVASWVVTTVRFDMADGR